MHQHKEGGITRGMSNASMGWEVHQLTRERSDALGRTNALAMEMLLLRGGTTTVS
jgi:hypothetical protein